MADLIQFNTVRAFDTNGDPAAGAKAYFYVTGTSTPVTVYQDEALTTPHASPVVADAAGIFAAVFYGGASAVKAVIKDSADVTISTLDPVLTFGSGATGAANIAFSPTVEIADTNVQDAIETVQGNAVTKTGSSTVTGTVDISGGTLTLADDQIAGAKVAAATETTEGVVEKSTSAENVTGTATDKFPDVAGVKEMVDTHSTDFFAGSLLHVRDEKANTTVGGTFTSGAWRTRDLNTTPTNEITGASVATNQITLPAGTYFIDASAPASEVLLHKSKLYDTTAAADVIIGTSEYCSPGYNGHTRSFVSGRFTLSVESNLELRHYSSGTKASTGFGAASSFGVVEVYSEVKIWKVA